VALCRQGFQLKRFDDILECTESFGRRFEEDWELLQVRAIALRRTGRHDEALAAFDRSLELNPGEPFTYRNRALTNNDLGNHRAFLRDTLLAFAAHRDREKLRAQLRTSRALLRSDLRETWRAELETELGLDENLVRALREVLGELAQDAEQPDSEFATRLHDDLGSTVELIRAYGAQPVLLTYANTNQPDVIPDTIRSAAREFGVPLVDVTREFERILENASREDYFSSDDSHPNDRGYGVVARLVAERIRTLPE
jgi:tetratricopeptide (TPR) repeat protein